MSGLRKHGSVAQTDPHSLFVKEIQPKWVFEHVSNCFGAICGSKSAVCRDTGLCYKSPQTLTAALSGHTKTSALVEDDG